MFKVDSGRLIKITKLIDRANLAINTLERLGQNNIVYLELKKELQDCSDELKSAYGLENFEKWEEKKKIVSKS